MRAKDFNTGLRGVLFEARHYLRMGQAVWLYGWLVLRQTRQVGTMGLVLGGRPVSYREIEEETGFHPRTLERWMRVLRREGYIETTPTPAGVIVRITKAKKFPQMPADWRALAHKSAGRLANSAGQSPQNCRHLHSQAPEGAGVAGGMGSGYVEDEIQTRLLQQTSPIEATDSTAEAWRRVPAEPVAGGTETCSITRQWRDRREAREELVRRELGVGQGPELSGR
jgi:hypothetical protein